MNSYAEGHVKKNKRYPSTQRTDCSLRAVKTSGNTESRAGRKEYSWDAKDGDDEGCNQEATSGRSEQTLV